MSTLSFFELIAELNIALAGFAGISSVVGSPDRQRGVPLRRQRLTNILWTSLFPTTLILGAMSAMNAGADESNVVRWGSVMIALPGLALTLRTTWVGQTSGRRIEPLARVGMVVSVVTYLATIWNAFGPGATWILLVALTVTFANGCLAFALLLLERNEVDDQL